MAFIAVYITNESKEAAQLLADALLDSRLIACANIFPMASTYLWQGNIAKEDEWVAIVKTTTRNWQKLKDKVTKIHVDIKILPKHYPWVGESLLAGMKEVLGDAATPEILNAWEEAYGFLAKVFIAKEEELYAE